MADYDPVTVDDFTARFPIFADADPDQITQLLTEAMGTVDNSWGAADYRSGVLYLTAHLLALDDSQAGDQVAIGPAGSGKVISSESIGGMSVSYFNGFRTASTVTPSIYTETEYGRRFLDLLSVNRPGPVVI